MATAYWTGVYYTISSNWDNGVTSAQKEWIHSTLDWHYHKPKRAWRIAIDVTTPSELEAQGFVVIDPRTESEPVLPEMAPEPSRPDDAPIFLPVPLFDYQLTGVEMILGGRRILADEAGVGKTRQLMTVAYNLDAERVLFVVPKIAITEPWSNQLKEISQIVQETPNPITRTGGNLVVVQSKAHMKRLQGFTNGVVLTTDSALSANEEFAQWLIEWQPQVMIYDEAHNSKNFRARVTQHLRAVSMQVPFVVTATGSPILKDSSEVMTQLIMTKTIDYFGGLEEFLQKYTWEDQWHNIFGLRRKTAEIRSILDDHIWIRRTKEVAIANMPKKIRRFIDIDVPLETVHAVHDEIIEAIDEWLKEYRKKNDGYAPSLPEIQDWASDNLRYITQMRVAAGVAKVEHVAERIERWVNKYGTDRPLVVWAYYQDTITALYKRSMELNHKIGLLDGTRSRAQRDRVVTAFQNGELDCVIASISAAGTAITLTRAHDELFAELDWTPDLIVQAEDRCYRLGQTETVRITTLIAKGTLDEHVQRVLNRKIKFLEEMVSGDHSVASGADRSFRISELLVDLVKSRLNGD